MSAHFTTALAVALVVCAAVADVRERRVPNRLTYPVLLVGLIAQAVLHGWKGLLLGIAGGLLFGGIFLMFYVIRTMGAGDVKLAAALGCVVGWHSAIELIFATALAGGALAIGYVLWARRVRQTVHNLLSVIGFHARHGLQAHPTVNLDSATAIRMPYALAFAVGTLYWATSSLIGR